MQNRKAWAGIGVSLLLIAIAALIIRKNHDHPVKSQGAPELTAEQILNERAEHASKLLETPLGRAFAKRNWPEVDQLLHPESDFIKLGEIIRSLYIDQLIQSYTPIDQQKLMSIVLSTFDKMDDKNFHQAGMLVTQFERLPTPHHDSENFKSLKSWVLNPEEKPLKRSLGMVKLVLNDANPDPQLVSQYQKTLLGGDTLGRTPIEWVQRLDEVRSVHTQDTLLENLLKNIKKIPEVAQAQALVVFAHHVEMKPQEIKSLTFKFLHSDNQGRFEASLRALPPLIEGKWLKDAEKREVINTLTNISDRMKTPFVEIKSKEILSLLEHT